MFTRVIQRRHPLVCSLLGTSTKLRDTNFPILPFYKQWTLWFLDAFGLFSRKITMIKLSHSRPTNLI